jgi:hypothetical protein
MLKYTLLFPTDCGLCTRKIITRGCKMKSTRYINLLLLLFCPIPLLHGCGGPTHAVISDSIQPGSNNTARIVVTREKQIAGMTTPVYILDAGEDLQTNATLKIRVGEWRKATTPHLFFINSFGSAGFVVAPMSGTTFAETGQTMDDLIDRNVDAVVFVDYLRCEPDKVNPVYCGNGEKECDEPFRKQLESSDGVIMGDAADLEVVEEEGSAAMILDTQAVRELYGPGPLPKNSKKRFREVQVIGKILGGDTIVWDRKPGIMRVGSVWGTSESSGQTLEFTPVNLKVQAGKTYYLHYTINLGERWRIVNVE